VCPLRHVEQSDAYAQLRPAVVQIDASYKDFVKEVTPLALGFRPFQEEAFKTRSKELFECGWGLSALL
jgi:hypothetical protein